MSIIDKVRNAINPKNLKNSRIPRTLKVKSAFNLTPNMRRVTLHGEDLASFPQNSEGAYIKLLFNLKGQTKPVMRTYTVVEQRSEKNEIDVDFMLHGNHNINSNQGNSSNPGIAGPWSLETEIGDEISIAGPGPATFINTDAEYLLLAGDMTALPALTVNLKRLPQTAHGHVFIEILSEADKQDLIKPENVTLNWIINDQPGCDQSPLFDAIEKAKLPAKKLSTWVACEFKTMKKIRQYLREEKHIERPHLYVSSYWKKGNTEDLHKKVKQADAEQAAT